VWLFAPPTSSRVEKAVSRLRGPGILLSIGLAASSTASSFTRSFTMFRRTAAGYAEVLTHHYMQMSIGGSNMGERTPNPENDETPDSKHEAGDAAAGSAAEQAKEREREMEESGEENAA
jgi:hypothetical protein